MNQASDINQPGIKQDNEHHCSLISRMAQGDEAALTEFYRIFEARVYAFVKNKLNDPHDAADLLNTVMLEIWKSASRFEGRSRVTTWVFGIAHNRVIDRLRSKSKHEKGRESMDDWESKIPDESEQGMDKIIAQKEIGIHLNHCLEKLSKEQQQVVHLAFFEDLSYREIGEIVNSPEGTIKARMFHAKQGLKRCLARQLEITE